MFNGSKNRSLPEIVSETTAYAAFAFFAPISHSRNRAEYYWQSIIISSVRRFVLLVLLTDPLKDIIELISPECPFLEPDQGEIILKYLWGNY